MTLIALISLIRMLAEAHKVENRFKIVYVRCVFALSQWIFGGFLFERYKCSIFR